MEFDVNRAYLPAGPVRTPHVLGRPDGDEGPVPARFQGHHGEG